MLQSLKVHNLALIDEAELELQPGFVCLTGETGTGKSMIIDALNLLSGARATADRIREGCRKALIEAQFKLTHVPQDMDLLTDEELFLRREIQADGRSRAFVNGVAVPVAQMSRYAELAFEIHGQHGHQALLNDRHHTEIFDRSMGLQDQANEFADTRAELLQRHENFWKLRGQSRERQEQVESLLRKIEEIDHVNPTPEDEELELKLSRARHGEIITRTSHEIVSLIGEWIHPNLRRIRQNLSALIPYDTALQPYESQLEGVRAVMDELASDMEVRLSDMDEELDIQALETRVSALNRLFMRFGHNVSEVMEERAHMQTQVEQLRCVDQDLESEARALTRDYETVRRKGRDLVDARREASTRFCCRVTSVLKELAFSQARFELQEEIPNWPDTLPDTSQLKLPVAQLRFMFGPNPGEPTRPLSKIASGGELSRVLLAVIHAFDRSLPKTLIFDEVDAGVGGETARSVGRTLAALGSKHQVLCVTHLAQVACHAQQHYSISKQRCGQRTRTQLTLCSGEERVTELARMLGGDPQAPALREHARVMMDQVECAPSPPRT